MSVSFFLHFPTSLSLFILTFTLANAQKPSPSPGLTRDFCKSSTACLSPRKCYILNNATLLPSDILCPRFDACRCAPPSYTYCEASSDCDDSEICARTLLFPFVCTSFVHVDSFKNRVVTVEDSRSDPLVPSCAPPSTPSDGVPLNGLVFDRCLPGTCADGLSCVFNQGDGKYQCCADGQCECHAPDTRPICKFTSDCNNGEVCGFGPTLPQQCYARKWLRTTRPALWRTLTVLTASPTPTSDANNGGKPTGAGAGSGSDDAAGDGDGTTSPASDSPAPSEEGDNTEGGEGESEEAICVDAEALRHLSRHELVFKNDRFGRVLCDSNESCATPGHIVKFRGTPMMMKSYCALVGCVERVKRVNSMRYRRSLTVKSETHELEYTAFAARFTTRAEEGLLAAALRMGL